LSEYAARYTAASQELDDLRTQLSAAEATTRELLLKASTASTAKESNNNNAAEKDDQLVELQGKLSKQNAQVEAARGRLMTLEESLHTADKERQESVDRIEALKAEALTLLVRASYCRLITSE
jgi:chromosome segregation ATPase